MRSWICPTDLGSSKLKAAEQLYSLFFIKILNEFQSYSIIGKALTLHIVDLGSIYTSYMVFHAPIGIISECKARNKP